MAIKTIPRERIFVSEQFIVRLYSEQGPRYSEELKPAQIPDYIVHALVAESERRENARRQRN